MTANVISQTGRCEWCGDVATGKCGCDAEVEIDRLRDVVSAATAERDAALVDAGRYRWLRANISWSIDLQTRIYYYRVPNHTGLDAAIDAAISESGGK